MMTTSTMLHHGTRCLPPHMIACACAERYGIQAPPTTPAKASLGRAPILLHMGRAPAADVTGELLAESPRLCLSCLRAASGGDSMLHLTRALATAYSHGCVAGP